MTPGIGKRTDPLLAFSFVVRIDGDPFGGFSEVSGLQAEVDTLELVEGGENAFVHKLPGRVKHGNVTLRRGLASIGLWDWFSHLIDGVPDRRTVAIELLPPSGGPPERRWVLESAFPCRWNGPEFKADQSALAIEAVELCHHGFHVA